MSDFMSFVLDFCFSKHRTLMLGTLLIGIVSLSQWETLFYGFDLVDSPTVLIQALMYSPYQYFTSPYAYEILSKANLTPWVTLSFELDYLLSGLDPLGYRIHHLASMMLMVLIIYTLLLRVNVSPITAFVFSWAISVAPAVIDVNLFPSQRHYIEGLIFCLLSCHCILQYNRQEKYYWLIASALLYALASTAKEIYLPLPGMLFFMLRPSLRQRVIGILPFAVIAVTYVVWRFYMLRGSFGGYDVVGALGVPSGEMLGVLFYQIISSFFGSKVQSLVLFGTLLVVVILNYQKLSLNFKVGALVGVILVILPLVSLVPLLVWFGLTDRWLFLPVISLLVLFALLCRDSTRVVVRFSVILVFFFAFTATYEQVNNPKKSVLIYDNLIATLLTDDSSFYIDVDKSYNSIMAVSTASWINVNRLDSGYWGILDLLSAYFIRSRAEQGLIVI
jgi:hypothetical protein